MNMKRDKEHLYVILHMPKCGGSTFRKSMEHGLSRDEFISVYPREETFNLKTWQRHMFGDLDKFRAYLKSLTKEEKDKIRILHGHSAFYGIHEYFDRPVRYVFFVREPVARTKSLYNFEVTKWNNLRKDDGHLPKTFQMMLDYQKENFIQGNKVPSFWQWFDKMYAINKNEHLFYTNMAFFLKSRGYLSGRIDKKSVDKALKKFYFIGSMDSYDEDSLFLYSKLGIRRVYGAQNVSVNHFSKFTTKERKKIEGKNKVDKYLYLEALKINRKFKRKNRDFESSVNGMKVREKMSPATIPLFDNLYKLSALLRKSKLYSKSLDRFKEKFRFAFN